MGAFGHCPGAPTFQTSRSATMSEFQANAASNLDPWRSSRVAAGSKARAPSGAVSEIHQTCTLSLTQGFIVGRVPE